MGGLLGWGALSWSDRIRAGRIARVILRARGGRDAAVPANQTVTDWLAAEGQPATLVAGLWRPLAIAALNQSPDVAAAATFVRVLANLFGPHSTDAAIALPSVPLDELYAVPAVRALEAAGGEVLLDGRYGGTRRIRPGRGSRHAQRAHRLANCRECRALARLRGALDRRVPPRLATTAARAAALASSPIVTIEFWNDRPVLTAPVDSVRRLGRQPVALGIRQERDLRRRGRARVGRSSGATELLAHDNATLTATALRELARLLPAASGARCLRSVVIREPRASFSVAPGGRRGRVR